MEPKAHVDNAENLSCNLLKVERVIKCTFAKYGVQLPITENMRASFKSKLWRMGQRISKLGSVKRRELLESWKSGRDSIWQLQVDAVMVNKELIKVKRKNEVSLAAETTKRHKLEQQLQKTQTTLKEKVSKLETQIATAQAELKCATESNDNLSKSNKRLAAAIAQGNHTKKRRVLSSVSRQQQWVRKKQIHTDIRESLSFLESEGVHASSITLVHDETNDVEVLDIAQGTYSKGSDDSMTTQDSDDYSLEMVLYVKERFGLSNAAYHELSMVCRGLPRSWKMKDFVQCLNSLWDIKPCPEGCGMQQTLESRLVERVRQLLHTNKINAGDKLQVKLSGDGTKVCRKLNLVNFTFTLLNEEDIAMSSRGNHTIAILNVPEDYEKLATALRDIIAEVETLTSISIDSEEFEIEYFLCSDLKFLAIVCGIEAANSTYACVWCKCPAADRYDMDKQWSVSEAEQGARSVTEITECCTKPKKQRFNCAHPPLFSTIPLDHVVPDVLHLFLRVTDVLFNLLVLEIRRLDGIERIARTDSINSTNLSVLESFINDSCHIPFRFFVCKESKQLKWRDLMGPEKLIFFEKADLPTLLPQMPNVEKTQALWRDYLHLHKRLQRKTFTRTEAECFGENAKQWVKDFTSIYQTTHVTPYIHVLAMHVSVFLNNYTNLVQFTQQGMEKLNDQTTIDYARSTNHDHRSLEALQQLIEKKNRIEFLEDHHCQRETRAIRCSICHEVGHNRLSCEKNRDKSPH